MSATTESFTPVGQIAAGLVLPEQVRYALGQTLRVSLSDSYIESDAARFSIVNSMFTDARNPSGEVKWSPMSIANMNGLFADFGRFSGLEFAPVANLTMTSYTGPDGQALSHVSPGDVYTLDLAEINITISKDRADAAAFAFGPDNDPDARSDIYLTDRFFASANGSTLPITKGGYTYGVLMHELLHTLGFSHPHDNPNFTQISGFAPLLRGGDERVLLDNKAVTILSHKGVYSQHTTPMILDVIALESVYGAGTGTSGAGDDRLLIRSAGSQTMLDLGGNDTVSLSSFYGGAYLHMGTAVPGAARLVGIATSLAESNKLAQSLAPSSLTWLYGEYENADGSFGRDLLIGNSLDNRINASGGDDTVEGGAGNDTLTGGDGLDTAVFQTAFDQAKVTYSKTSNAFLVETANEGADVVSGFETLSFAGQSFSATALASSAAPAPSLPSNGGGMQDAPAPAPAAPMMPLARATARGDRLTGSADNDSIDGFGGNDSINGLAGSDTLIGGLGKDVLTGGDGADVFRFDTRATKQNVDRITDFQSGIDHIELSKAVFGKLADLATQFVNGVPQDANDNLYFLRGNLMYDTDGIGKAKPVVIATLTGVSELSVNDLVLVD